MNKFEEIKKSVDIIEVAERYGIKLNRANKTLCIFHSEKTPSLSFSKTKQIFHCFGCSVSGDVLTLVSKLLNVNVYEAAKIINNDFKCGVDLDKPVNTYDYKSRRALEEQFNNWYIKTYNELCSYYQLLKTWQKQYEPESAYEEYDPRFVEALQNLSKIEYYIDFLAEATDEEKIQFWKQKVVDKIGTCRQAN